MESFLDIKKREFPSNPSKITRIQNRIFGVKDVVNKYTIHVLSPPLNKDVLKPSTIMDLWIEQ